MADEIFRTVEGFEDYQVSNLGRVISNKGGKSKFLKPQKDAIGYYHVRLFPEGDFLGRYEDGRGKKPKLYKVHKLVLETFNPTVDTLLQVNHINADKSDNRLVNLEWMTPAENIQHSWDSGLRDNAAEKAAVHRRRPTKVTYPDGTVEYFISRTHAALALGTIPMTIYNGLIKGTSPGKGPAKGCKFESVDELPHGEMYKAVAGIEEKLLQFREKYYGPAQKKYRKKWYAEKKIKK